MSPPPAIPRPSTRLHEALYRPRGSQVSIRRPTRSRRWCYYGVQQNPLDYMDSASKVHPVPHPFSPFAPVPSIPLSISSS